MEKLNVKDIWPQSVYKNVREEYRQKLIAIKKTRRIDIGPYATFIFENRDTVKFQIQELVRVENLLTAEQIQHELDAFNPLIPEKNSLCCTMMIAITDEKEIKPTLQRLVAIEENVYLEIDGEIVHAEFEPERSTEQKTSAVHYLRFRLTPEQTEGLSFAKDVLLSIKHPEYDFSITLTSTQRQALQNDAST